MRYLYALFIRDDKWRKQNQQRGFIAGKPVTEFPVYSDPFIVCKIDPAILSESVLNDDTICLDLATLCEKFPPTTETYVDEDGSEQPRIIAGYFDIDGRSSEKECPVITFDDCLPREVSDG